MATYLLTWNPARWQWDDFDECIDAVRENGECQGKWSAGNTRRIQSGDRLFLLKLGEGTCGIIGFGVATGEVFEAAHYTDTERIAFYVPLVWRGLFHDPILTIEQLKQHTELGSRPDHWSPQASGTSIPDAVATILERLWSGHVVGEITFFADQVDGPRRFVEGATTKVWVNAYERNPAARQACIDHYGAVCRACRFDFSKMYGELGRDYIHVHHVKSLSQIDGQYEVDPINDLCPVCANCHAMLHRGQQSEARTIEELKRIIDENRDL